VTNSAGSLYVSYPNPVAPATPDQTTTIGTNVTLSAARAGGAAGAVSWAATDLPPGLTIDTAGLISGVPTTAGRYVVTLTVRDSIGKTAILMFIWTVR
jgi:hypothetical protein